MPRCCRGNLPPAIEEGRHIQVSGEGSPDNPFLLTVTTELDVEQNDTFNVLLTGNGELDSPWRLEVRYDPNAKLTDPPDVDATGLLNGYVLHWDSAAAKWVPGAPTTAAPGAVQHGNGLTGDGSVGSPLTPVVEAARYVRLAAAGVGLTDEGLRRLVRIYANSAARDLETVAPVEGSVSVLTTEPGTIWQYNSGVWKRATGVKANASGQLLSLSGGYAGGPVEVYIRQLGFTTAADGSFTVIPAGDLSGYSGVLSAHVQPTGATSWRMGTVRTSGGTSIVGTARRDADGTAYGSQVLAGVVTAHLYK